MHSVVKQKKAKFWLNIAALRCLLRGDCERLLLQKSLRSKKIY